MANRSGRSWRVSDRQSIPVVVLVVVLAVAASAVALLAVGQVAAIGIVGDPPRPGWTLAPGPWSDAVADSNRSVTEMREAA